MAQLFFDTSAMLKHWVHEPGTDRVRALTVPTAGHRLLITRLLLVEAVGQIVRRLSGSGAAAADIRRTVAEIRRGE